jgi:hypothetical protein
MDDIKIDTSNVIEVDFEGGGKMTNHFSQGKVFLSALMG